MIDLDFLNSSIKLGQETIFERMTMTDDVPMVVHSFPLPKIDSLAIKKINETKNIRRVNDRDNQNALSSSLFTISLIIFLFKTSTFPS